MIESILIGAGKGLVIALAAFLALLWAFKRGQKDQEADTYENTLDDIHTANIVRDKLKSDSDYAKRVRDRFRR